MKSDEQRNKNREIETLRFLFTIAVCMHHLRYCSVELPYGGGYIAVDFFFIISGFYLRASYKTKGANIGVCQYLKKRYSRLIKDYIIAFMVALVINVIIFDLNISSNCFPYLKEAIMLEFGCMDSSLRINPPDWYCGYLILSSGLVYFFLQMKNIWGKPPL